MKSYVSFRPFEKAAFNIEIDPSSVLGALSGALVSGTMLKNQQQDAFNKQMAGNLVNVGADYYKDVQNLDMNTHVIFTPLSVLYVLKDGMSELVVDDISIDEMNDEVLQRFRNQDSTFFKNVMFNKIRSDIDLAERSFARRMIDKKMLTGLNKQATVSEHFSELGALIEKNASKSLIEYLVDEESFMIPVKFSDELDINKVAGIFGEALSFLGPKSQEQIAADIQGNLNDPQWLANNATVVFLPDRVMFVADKKVIAQLSILDMNEAGFEAFHDKNRNYFFDFFGEALGVKSNNLMDLFKRASSVDDISQIFYMPMVHPEIYFLALMDKMGVNWLTYDPIVLIKEIEEDFMLDRPIHDLALNKILTIQAANAPANILFKNIKAFEKMVRAMVDKPIDFALTEDNLSLGEIVFALQAMNNVTPGDEIHDNLSPGVIDYIINILANQNVRLVYPVAKTELEALLYGEIDKEVRREIFEYMYAGLPEETIVSETGQENMLAAQAKMLINDIRSRGGLPEDISAVITEHWKNLGSIAKLMGEEIDVLMLTSRNMLEDNLAVDAFLDFREKQLVELKSKFFLQG